MNKAELYAQTLFEASQADDFDAFFKKFIGFLESRDEQKLLPKIVAAVADLEEKRDAGSKTIITVASKGDVTKFSEELKSMSDSFDVSEATIVEDPNIVGGYIARSSTAMIDASYRKGLLEMYQRLTM